MSTSEIRVFLATVDSSSDAIGAGWLRTAKPEGEGGRMVTYLGPIESPAADGILVVAQAAPRMSKALAAVVTLAAASSVSPTGSTKLDEYDRGYRNGLAQALRAIETGLLP